MADPRSALKDSASAESAICNPSEKAQRAFETAISHSAIRNPQSAIYLWLLLPLLAFAWFWAWRAGMITGGDSDQWEREINQGYWFRRRQMFSFAAMQLAFTLGRAWAGWSSRRAIQFVSCLAGALAMLALARLVRGRPRPALAFSIVATAGFTTIFYGHIETYAQPVVALLLHLLAIRNVLQRRWPPWTVAATFCLVLFFHLVILFALPATLGVLALEIRRRGAGRRAWLPVAAAALPGAAFWWAITSRHWGAGELVGPHFIALLPDLARHPWIIFTHANVPTKLRFLFWDGGFTALVAFGVFARALWRPRRDPFLFYLALYFVCFLGFTAVWNPDAVERDFDLFCFPWVIAAVGVAWSAHRLPWRPVLLGLIFGVNAYLFLTRTVSFADLPQRGAGTILFESAIPTDALMIRMDDEFALYPVNRAVPSGVHPVTVKGRGRILRRWVNLRPGETVRLYLDASGLHINP